MEDILNYSDVIGPHPFNMFFIVNSAGE